MGEYLKKNYHQGCGVRNSQIRVVVFSTTTFENRLDLTIGFT